MKNFFYSKGLYDTVDILNFIMNCDSKYHKDILSTLQARSKNLDDRGDPRAYRGN